MAIAELDALCQRYASYEAAPAWLQDLFDKVCAENGR